MAVTIQHFRRPTRAHDILQIVREAFDIYHADTAPLGGGSPETDPEDFFMRHYEGVVNRLMTMDAVNGQGLSDDHIMTLVTLLAHPGLTLDTLPCDKDNAARLAQGAVNRETVEIMTAHLDAATAHNDTLNEANDALLKENDAYKKSIGEMVRMMKWKEEEYSRERDAYSDTIINLNGQIDERETRISNMNGHLDERHKDIISLKARLDDHKAAIHGLSVQLQEALASRDQWRHTVVRMADDNSRERVEHKAAIDALDLQVRMAYTKIARLAECLRIALEDCDELRAEAQEHGTAETDAHVEALREIAREQCALAYTLRLTDLRRQMRVIVSCCMAGDAADMTVMEAEGDLERLGGEISALHRTYQENMSKIGVAAQETSPALDTHALDYETT